jgi:hypothetical protein
MLEFLLAVAQIILFIGLLSVIIFVFVIGAHAAVSKKPVEENLHPKMVRRRFQNMIILSFGLLFIEFVLNKIKHWWKS